MRCDFPAQAKAGFGGNPPFAGQLAFEETSLVGGVWTEAEMFQAGWGDLPSSRGSDDKFFAEEVGFDFIGKGFRSEVHGGGESFDAGRPTAEDTKQRL